MRNKKPIWQDMREHPILTVFILVFAFFVVKFFHDNWHESPYWDTCTIPSGAVVACHRVNL